MTDDNEPLPRLTPLPPVEIGIPPDLEKHIKAVKALLVVYLVALGLFWVPVLDGSEASWVATLSFWLGGPAYCALIVECAIVQQRLYRAGSYQHRGWQVIVGGLILNPFVLGWFIPISVLMTVRRIR